MPDAHLVADNLEGGSLKQVASEWCRRVKEADETVFCDQLYCGRGFQEGLNAARACHAQLMVLSAGLGLVPSAEKIPAYSLTVSSGTQDCILDKVEPGPVGPPDWWAALSRSLDTTVQLRRIVSDIPGSLTLMPLSGTYARMIIGELEDLSDGQVSTLRIFGLNIARYLPDRLNPQIMPIDARLDGPDSPIPGTRSDFGGRALRHYVDLLIQGVLGGESAESDARHIRSRLSTWRQPGIPKRKPLSDSQVHDFIRKHWHRTGGRSSTTLRLLRDSGLACEQFRFKELFRSFVEGGSPSEKGTLL